MVNAGDPAFSSDITTIEDYTTGGPVCRLIAQSAQSIANNATAFIQYGVGSEDIDTHGWHDESTNNTRYTPLLAGYYQVTVTTIYAADAGAWSWIDTGVAKTGTVVAPLVRHKPTTGNFIQYVSATAIVSVNGTTDYIEHFTRQVTGGARNTNAANPQASTMEIIFLRPL